MVVRLGGELGMCPQARGEKSRVFICVAVTTALQSRIIFYQTESVIATTVWTYGMAFFCEYFCL
jgi:hypothetical protein